jgi:hypothetical protein
MLRRSFTLLTLAMLSGCTLTQSKNHEETLIAINTMESNVNIQLETMTQQINEQNEHIANLENELSSVSKDVKFVKHKVLTQPKLVVEKQVITIPAEAKPIDVKVANGKAVLGQEEWIWLDSVKQYFKARIDTGATTSSLNAVDLQVFERDGKEWVRFNLSHLNDETSKKPEIIEAPVVRWVKIRQSTSEEAARRPVIDAWIQLGSLHEKVQFTLADRTQMAYPVLLGREFFKDIALVDVGKQFIQGKSQPETASKTNN